MTHVQVNLFNRQGAKIGVAFFKSKECLGYNLAGTAYPATTARYALSHIVSCFGLENLNQETIEMLHNVAKEAGLDYL